MIAATSCRRAGLILLLPGLITCGCASMNNTEKGVAAGGVIGAGTGALVGNAVGHTGAGALIGAGVGALSGGLIGNAADESEKKAQARAAAQARAMGMTDVVALTQQHVSEAIIINQIRASGAVFHLSAQDIVWLKENGVTDVVVNEMQMTAYRMPRRVYVVEPEPPPVSVGVGIGYGRRW